MIKKKKFSLNDLNNEDELDFSFKDLDEKELDAFCHAVTSWQVMTSDNLLKNFWVMMLLLRTNKNLQMKSLKKFFLI